MHGVALVEAGAEHEQAFEFAAQDRSGRAARAGIAEHAKRKRVVLGEHALRPQRRGHRQRPALREFAQARRGLVVLDAGAGEHGDAHRCIFSAQQLERTLGRCRAERPALREEAGHGDVIGHDLVGQRVVRQREMHRSARLRPHRGEPMA